MTPSITAALLASSAPTAPPTVPAAPVLSGSPGNGQAILTWTQPNDGGSALIQYPVYRSTDGVTFGPIANVDAPNLTYIAGNLTNGVPWYFYIKARNAIGTGPQSNIVTVTPAAPLGNALLGIYDESNTISGQNSVASSYGVLAEMKVYSFYTTGDSYGSISSWTPGQVGTLPSGAVFSLAVNPCPGNGNLQTTITNAGNAAKNCYQTLAGHLPNGTIIRLGWEFDGNWYPWNRPNSTYPASSTNTPAQYVTVFQTIVTWMRAINPTLLFDWCCNTGSSTSLAMYESYFPGASYVDFIGGDHYNQPGGPDNTFSSFNYVTTVANTYNKQVSVPEWGQATQNPQDDPNFISDGAQFMLNPTAAASRYGFASYTVGYQSYFNALGSQLSNFPNSKARYTSLFA